MSYQLKSIRGPFITYDATAGQGALNDGGIFRIRDIEPDIPFKRPYSAMFYKLLTAVPHGRVATQDKVLFGEQEKMLNFVTVAASVGAGDTSITVTDAYNCVPGDKLINWRTGELIRLDAVDSATVVSVAASTGYGRGFSGSTAATMRIGDRLYKMGNALTERGRTPDTISKLPVEAYNFCSYYIAAVAVSRLQESSVMLGNFGKMSEQMANQLYSFREQINADLWKGRRSLTVVPAASAHDSGGGNLYQMNGFDAQVHTHAYDLSSAGQMTYELWNEILSPMFDNDSGDRFMNCGKNVMASIKNTARGNVTPTVYPSILEGVNITAIAVDGGTVHLVPDYDGLPPGSARVWHPQFVEYREREGMSEQWIMNTKLPTQVMDEVNTLMAGGTLIVRNEETMAKIDGVGGPFTRGLTQGITG
jgi:hypothetical protein